MKRVEEELQHLIENGLLNESSEDTRAYQHVFDVLKKEPDFHVSLPFADRIVALIEKKEEKHDYLWMATGIFFIVVTLIVSLALSNIHWTTGIFTFISGYSGLITFGIAFILLLQWVERKVIKKRIEFR
jgi:hypothetical protein